MGNCCGCMATSTAGIINAKKWRDPALDRILDIIREAGGNAYAEVLITLVWNSRSDLDMHLFVPEQLNDRGLTNGTTGEIYYDRHNIYKGQAKWNSGYLDIDANTENTMRAHPVENIAFDDVRRMPDGNYLVSVNNYKDRASAGGNKFTILIAFKDAGRTDFTQVLVMNSKFSLDVSNPTHQRTNSFFDLVGFRVSGTENGKTVKITHVNSGGFDVVLKRDVAFAEGVNI